MELNFQKFFKDNGWFIGKDVEGLEPEYKGQLETLGCTVDVEGDKTTVFVPNLVTELDHFFKYKINDSVEIEHLVGGSGPKKEKGFVILNRFFLIINKCVLKDIYYNVLSFRNENLITIDEPLIKGLVKEKEIVVEEDYFKHEAKSVEDLKALAMCKECYNVIVNEEAGTHYLLSDSMFSLSKLHKAHKLGDVRLWKNFSDKLVSVFVISYIIEIKPDSDRLKNRYNVLCGVKLIEQEGKEVIMVKEEDLIIEINCEEKEDKNISEHICKCKCEEKEEEVEDLVFENMDVNTLIPREKRYLIELVKKSLEQNNVVKEYIDQIISHFITNSYFYLNKSRWNFDIEYFQEIPVSINNLALKLQGDYKQIFLYKFENNSVLKQCGFNRWQYDEEKIRDWLKEHKKYDVVVKGYTFSFTESFKENYKFGMQFREVINNLFLIKDLITDIEAQHKYSPYKFRPFGKLLQGFKKEDFLIYKPYDISDIEEYIAENKFDIISFFKNNYIISMDYEDNKYYIDFKLRGKKQVLISDPSYEDKGEVPCIEVTKSTWGEGEKRTCFAEMSKKNLNKDKIKIELYDWGTKKYLEARQIEEYIWMVENVLKALYIEYVQDLIDNIYNEINENILKLYDNEYIIELIKLNKIIINAEGKCKIVQ